MGGRKRRVKIDAKPARKRAGRVQITKAAKKKPKDIYGLAECETKVLSSGCTLLDCVLGGGWPLGRMINVVGDKSTGKTLLATEACANFLAAYKTGKVYYVETEAAFDRHYAAAIGLDVEKVYFPNDPKKWAEVRKITRPKKKTGSKKETAAAKSGEVSSTEGRPIRTIEDLYYHLRHVIRSAKGPIWYVVDSLDAISCNAELGQDIDVPTFGTSKAAAVSGFFRRLNAISSDANVTLFFVSQIRAAIGVTFGNPETRSGGKALDFYASIVLWLAHKARIKRTRNRVERVIGVRIRAKGDKNKIGPPHRECDFPIHFEYGTEDVVAGLEFLIGLKETKRVGLTETQAKMLVAKVHQLDAEAYDETRADVSAAVEEVWEEIEKSFRPSRKKYR